MTKREFLLRFAVLGLVVATAFLASPRFVGQAYATYAGCQARCNTGTCSADPEAGETCSCGCTFWGNPKCTCTQEIAPSTPG